MQQDIFNRAAGYALDLYHFLAVQAEAAFRPWVFYQIGIAVALFGLAHLAGRAWGGRLHDRLRTRQGWPKWRMRTALVLIRRLRGILFVPLIWAAVWVLRETTWPSRSFLLTIIGNLALAWVVVGLASRLILNRVLRAVVQYGAWIWLTLSVLGQTEAFVALLSRITLDLGGLTVSAWMVVQAAVAVTILLAAARFLSRISAARINSNEEMSPSMRVLSVKAVQLGLYGAAFLFSMKAVGVDLTGLAVLSGAIGVGLGFGLQKVVSNLVSGIIILLDKSVKPGDVISLGETFGWINALGARYVSVVTRDGREYLIPNEDMITGQVVNWSHSNEFVRLDIFFGTAYSNDPHEVRRIAVEAAQGVGRVLGSKPPVCHITGFGDSSVDYILRFWITDPTGGLTNVRGAVYLALWDAFRENGISIPFPQREVRILGSEPDREEGEAAAPGRRRGPPPIS
ncbi:mechanosensitive ion channel family protein [Mangrovicoccus algicola]|uniref:Mechanosensitive ion channel n=1 Tax=Mangrovicoccus algicola TaxID=2771008 RepID=A0A8J7CIJ9_9RHOB|nr:mechanosensitive ion channel domain-containing protein [Mangrovicoccus algicola]MBE3639645.1 mechanosensitive ion channel [Mangrovicoccus algicola]